LRGHPLQRATVLIVNTKTPVASTLAGEDGAFVFTDLPADKYSLQAVKTGYLGVPPGHYVLNQVNQNNGGIARSTMIDLTRGTVDEDATSANFDSDQT
jgi:hypothetical protein